MSNHTTGPWYVRNILGRGVEVHWKDDNEHPICHMRWSDGLREVVELRIDADASLIAAAPALLAALKAIRPQCIGHDKFGCKGECKCCDARRQADAAIAIAEGTTP